MDLKKKIKGFFTLTRKANGGFTLVELIVVIAILAILAGVAVPAYNGYIKKADRSADDALLNEINTAFASACMANGESNFNRTDRPTIAIDGTTGAVAIDALNTSNDDVDASFAKFFEGGAFNDIAMALSYNKTLGMFTNIADNIFNQIFTGLDLTAETEKLNNSIFSTIGAEALMEKVDVVTDLVVNAGGAFANMLMGEDGANLDAMAKAMGYTGMDDENFQKAFDTMVAKKTAEGMDVAQANNYILGNYAVLQTAKTTAASTKSTSDWLSDLQGNDFVTMTKNLINQDSVAAQQEGMSQAAMMYAMYTAYANGLDDGDANKAVALENAKDVNKFVTAIGADTGFTNYLKNEDGKAAKDLEGYLASMSIIDKSVVNNGEAVTDLLENGYNNPELIAGINGLLG